MLKKKTWANFQRIIELFSQKIVTKLSKIWVWDPWSGKNLFRIPDPGVKKTPDPGSGTLLPTLKRQDFVQLLFLKNCAKYGLDPVPDLTP
jgi:hypothetical protein